MQLTFIHLLLLIRRWGSPLCAEGRSLSAAPLALGKLYETLRRWAPQKLPGFSCFIAAVFVGQLVSFVTELLDFCSVTVTGAWPGQVQENSAFILSNLYMKTPLLQEDQNFILKRLFDWVSSCSAVVLPFLQQQRSKYSSGIFGWHWKRVSGI